MTVAARIKQADIDRAVKAADKSARPARVIMRLAKAEIEIIIGESDAPAPERNPFDED